DGGKPDRRSGADVGWVLHLRSRDGDHLRRHGRGPALPALGAVRRRGIVRRTFVALPWLVGGLLVAAPWLVARHQLSILAALLIFGLLALSLDLIMGYTGMVSFGHAAYFGLGAYAGALALLTWQVPIPLALAGGALCAALIAWPIGYLSTRR